MNVIMLPADEFVAPPEKSASSGDKEKLSDAEFRAQLAQRATSVHMVVVFYQAKKFQKLVL